MPQPTAPVSSTITNTFSRPPVNTGYVSQPSLVPPPQTSFVPPRQTSFVPPGTTGFSIGPPMPFPTTGVNTSQTKHFFETPLPMSSLDTGPPHEDRQHVTKIYEDNEGEEHVVEYVPVPIYKEIEYVPV